MQAWKNQFSGTCEVFHSQGKDSIPADSYSEQAWEALWRPGSALGLSCFKQVLAGKKSGEERACGPLSVSAFPGTALLGGIHSFIFFIYSSNILRLQPCAQWHAIGWEN